MRKRIRRTEITFERSKSFVIRNFKGAVIAWCHECDARVQFLSPEEAAVEAQVSLRTIYRWVESGKVHFTETADARLYICLASLAG